MLQASSLEERDKWISALRLAALLEDDLAVRWRIDGVGVRWPCLSGPDLCMHHTHTTINHHQLQDQVFLQEPLARLLHTPCPIM